MAKTIDQYREFLENLPYVSLGVNDEMLKDLAYKNVLDKTLVMLALGARDFLKEGEK